MNSSFWKKTMKTLFFSLLAVLIIVNMFILLSGRTYLYRGVYLTYLQGKTGPTIYDLEHFSKRKVAKGVTKSLWKKSSHYVAKINDSEFDKYNRKMKTKAFLVFQGNDILFEKYYDKHNENTISNSFSVAKTVISLLIGVAIEEGKIKSLDQAVSDFIPEFKREDLSVITIRHLLLMSSGLNWTESGKNPLSHNAEAYYGTQLYELVTRQKRIKEPGKTFIYQSGNTQLLSYVLKSATGKTISDYCSEKLWSQLDMESDAYWNLDHENGDEKAYCCLYATARDFGKLGKLISQKGLWNGKQLLPKWYIEQMTSVPRNMKTEDNINNYQYGLHIWIYQGYSSPVYYCRGILGQYIISIPEENLVIVRLGEKRIESIQLDGKEITPQTKIKRIGHALDFLKYISFAEEIVKQSKYS